MTTSELFDIIIANIQQNNPVTLSGYFLFEKSQTMGEQSIPFTDLLDIVNTHGKIKSISNETISIAKITTPFDSYDIDQLSVINLLLGMFATHNKTRDFILNNEIKLKGQVYFGDKFYDLNDCYLSFLLEKYDVNDPITSIGSTVIELMSDDNGSLGLIGVDEANKFMGEFKNYLRDVN